MRYTGMGGVNLPPLTNPNCRYSPEMIEDALRGITTVQVEDDDESPPPLDVYLHPANSFGFLAWLKGLFRG